MNAVQQNPRHLIVSATTFEISPVMERLEVPSFVERPGLFVGSNNIDVLISGVGQAIAGINLSRTLARNSYASIINLGIAGSFNKTITNPCLVHVIEEYYADLGTKYPEAILDLFDMNLLAENTFPFSGRSLKSEGIPLATLSDMRKVTSATVNGVLKDPIHVKLVQQKFNADVVNMEGAGLFYAALSEGVSCTSVRAISNEAGEEDKARWDIAGAIRVLNQKANEIVDTLLR